MAWTLGVVLPAFLFVRFLLRRRRESIPMLPLQPISTFHRMRSGRTKRETKAALEAASALLE